MASQRGSGTTTKVFALGRAAPPTYRETVSLRPSASPFRRSLVRFAASRRAMVGAAIIALLIVCALFADVLSPSDPYLQDLSGRLLPPSGIHAFGTDELGRDVLSRIIHGTRISLMVGIVAIGISAGIGVTLGALAGYLGGKVDALIMRFADTVLAIPAIVLAIAMVAALGASLVNVMIALGLTGWVGYARVTRGNVLSLKQQPFVEASRAIGVPTWRIIFRDILPNAIAPIIVIATLGMAAAIVGEASLSFLGLGAQPPTASWGSMLATGRAYMRTAPHVATLPGLAIVVTVLGFNLFGDGLRDALDPRLIHEKTSGS